MKKFYFLLCLIALSFTGIGQFLSEDFNFSGLLTANGWTAHSGVGTNSASTTTGLTYTGYPGSGVGNAALIGNTGGEDVNITFTSQNTNGQDVYYAFLVNVNDAATAKTGDYFFHTGSPGGASWTSFAARVFVRIVSGDVNFGLSNTSTATWGATNFSKNTTYLLVVKYTINTAGSDATSLWVFTSGVPATEAAAGIPEVTNTTTTGTDAVNAVGLRQGSNSTQPQAVVDGIRVGTTWTSVTGGAAASPSLSASSLTGFNNVCINTTAGPNSFTITGTNLTTANVTVASLAGFTFSTTSGGTYASSLSLTQPGGTYSQQIFVKFDPTAVQSYNGNIAVGGGGASSINVAATGSGVNSAPSVTTGAASGITTTTATVAGSINDPGCTAVTAYGVEYSTTSGFANGTGTQVASTNLSGTNFSSSLSGLATGTTYYYKAYATNAGGISWGAEMSFTTTSLSPTLTATTLTGFGNVCSNTTAGPNSFTINGTNLTTANITVGPLAGFSFSTTSGGIYTSSLTLTQTGGTYSQQIFVKFNPTAVQSYNGNIPVSGGGTSVTTNVAVTGSGVNAAPTVATGAATGITTTAATLAGTISNIGCSAVTGYGIYYSTTSGFPNGSGTQVVSTNLSGTNFTAAVSGLTPATTYYFKAYTTNAGGTSYGAQQSFTTAAPPASVLSVNTLPTLGNVCVNATSTTTNSFTITGTNLTTAPVTVGPLAGYSFSTSATGTFTPSLSLTQPGGSFSQIVYVKLTPTAVQSYNGNIPVAGGGSTTTVNVAATGAGISSPPTVITNPPLAVTTSSAALPATITGSGCTPVTSYGIEYSGVNSFVSGTGTQIPSNNLNSGTPGMYSVTLTNLAQGATYYYKAYATNAGGTFYGVQQAVTINAIPKTFTLYPVPVKRGSELYFSMDSLRQGFYGIQLFNSTGQKVVEQGFNIQVGFINDKLIVPATMPPGIYRVRIISDTDILDTKTILITR
jgi:hypothetical protein